VVVLGSEVDGKVALVAKVSEAAVRRGAHAGELVKRVAELCGGSGGGRPHFAQAGGKDPARLSEALAQAIQIVAVQIGERDA
jgi:alanyl-tRNA synthetase